MRRLTRRSFAAAAGGAFAGAVFARHARAAEFTYKLTTTVTTGYPLTARALEAAAAVLRETSGRLEIQVYPNQALGTDQSVLAQLRLGAIEFVQAGHPPLSNLVPAAALDGLPFIFSSYDDAWRASDGALGNYIRAQIRKTGLYPIGRCWDGSLKQLQNNIRPIVIPEDFRGLKLRVVPGQVPIALLRALGATPTPLDFKECYTALQSRLIDGVDLSWAATESSRFYEVVKYGTRTNHIWVGETVLANGDAWQRLPKGLRDTVERNLDAAGLRERHDIKESDDQYVAELKKQGMAYNVADHAAFRATVLKAGLYGQWRGTFGDEAWSAVEKSVGPLG